MAFVSRLSLSFCDSRLLTEVSEIGINSNEMLRPVYSRSFCSEKHFAEFLSTCEFEILLDVLKRLENRNVNLFDFDYLTVDKQVDFRFIILALNNESSFFDYTYMYDTSDIPRDARIKLYEDIYDLEKLGILINNPQDLFYNPQNEDFKILSFRRLLLDDVSWSEKDYLEYYKRFCQID